MKNLSGLIAAILVVTAALFCHSNAHAQYYTDPLSCTGGSDAYIYNGDTVFIENTLTDDASGIAPLKTLSLNAAYIYSKYDMKTFIDMRYSLADFFELNFSLPFLIRTMSCNSTDEYSKYGFGDTKLGFSLFFNIAKILDSTTEIKMTLPTGDAAATDRGFIVPLGYGNMTWSLLESLSYDFPDKITRLPIRLFMNLGMIYYPKSIVDANSTIRYVTENGPAISSMLGAEYALYKFLKFQLKVNFFHFFPRDYKTELPGFSASDWIARNNIMTGSDIITAVKFNIKDYLSGSVIAVLPVIEAKSDAIPEDNKRKWKIMLNVNKGF